MQLILFLRRFLCDQRGVTAIEYGILAAGLAVVIGTLVSTDGAFSKAITEIFKNIVSNLPQGNAK
ncbi:Flp family type IVb pilin [Herbaspirillum sp. RV1423]|uniref:Flp family type IVb pilin n=1 Tax=Herbaspirillum sp. RV1423 TaxID=1443993 RepID=UPI0004ADA43E|nr:Flp family type IVb pilin [Herbaspirillum sp. RV1423]